MPLSLQHPTPVEITSTTSVSDVLVRALQDWMLIFFSFSLFHAPVTALNLAGYAFCCSGAPPCRIVSSIFRNGKGIFQRHDFQLARQSNPETALRPPGPMLKCVQMSSRGAASAWRSIWEPESCVTPPCLQALPFTTTRSYR